MKIKLDALTIYGAIQSLSGIDQATIYSAIDGNEGAAAAIADCRARSQSRKANAGKVFGNMKQIMEAEAEVMVEEGKFLVEAKGDVQKALSAWGKVRASDREMIHAVQQTVTGSDNRIRELDYKNAKTIRLMGTEHRTNLQLIDLQVIDRERSLQERVSNHGQKQESDQSRMNAIHRNGSEALRSMGRRVRGFFGSLFG